MISIWNASLKVGKCLKVVWEYWVVSWSPFHLKSAFLLSILLVIFWVSTSEFSPLCLAILLECVISKRCHLLKRDNIDSVAMLAHIKRYIYAICRHLVTSIDEGVSVYPHLNCIINKEECWNDYDISSWAEFLFPYHSSVLGTCDAGDKRVV